MPNNNLKNEEFYTWLKLQSVVNGEPMATSLLASLEGEALEHAALDWLRNIITSKLGTLTSIWAAQVFHAVTDYQIKWVKSGEFKDEQ